MTISNDLAPLGGMLDSLIERLATVEKVARNNKRVAPVIAQLDLTGAEDVSIQASSPVKKKGRSLPNFGRRK